MVGKSIVFLVFFTCFWIAVLHFGYCFFSATDTLTVTWSFGTSSRSTTLYDGDDMFYGEIFRINSSSECTCSQDCNCTCHVFYPPDPNDPFSPNYSDPHCEVMCDIDRSDDTHYDTVKSVKS